MAEYLTAGMLAICVIVVTIQSVRDARAHAQVKQKIEGKR